MGDQSLADGRRGLDVEIMQPTLEENVLCVVWADVPFSFTDIQRNIGDGSAKIYPSWVSVKGTAYKGHFLPMGHFYTYYALNETSL